jgi:hypothetical protein
MSSLHHAVQAHRSEHVFPSIFTVLPASLTVSLSPRSMSLCMFSSGQQVSNRPMDHLVQVSPTVDVTLLFPLDEVGPQELGHLLGMFKSRLDLWIFWRQRGLVTEAHSDRLLRPREDTSVAYSRICISTGTSPSVVMLWSRRRGSHTLKGSPRRTHKVPVSLQRHFEGSITVHRRDRR